MRLGRAVLAHVVAVQAASCLICVAMMIEEGGITAVPEGLGVWVFAQVFVLPFTLVSLPAMLLVRTVLGFSNWPPRAASILAGGVIGLVLAVIIGLTNTRASANFHVLVDWMAYGGLAGLFAGWVWWRIEQPQPFEPGA
jgi:hypothetical protein